MTIPNVAPTKTGTGNSRYDAKTALIVVDVQNDFADPKGGLSVKDGDKIIAAVNAEAAAAKAAGALVVYPQDWPPPVTPHFAKDGGIWPTHCVRDTWGAAFHPALVVDGPVVRKGVHGEDGYSGFSTKGKDGKKATELHSILRKRGIERLVVCGLASDYCVMATALDGADLGYATRVPRKAIKAVNIKPTDGAEALAKMRAAGIKVIA